jgi:predicted nucleic acid-binding Zn ribbon protein
MANAMWLLRCPECDNRFEYDSINLQSPVTLVKCPDCSADFKVVLTVSIEIQKLGLVKAAGIPEPGEKL